MISPENIMKLIEELDIYSKGELKEVYEQKRILEEKEKKLMDMESRLLEIKQELSARVLSNGEMEEERMKEIQILIEMIKSSSEEIMGAIKPINFSIIKELDLDK